MKLLILLMMICCTLGWEHAGCTYEIDSFKYDLGGLEKIDGSYSFAVDPGYSARHGDYALAMAGVFTYYWNYCRPPVAVSQFSECWSAISQGSHIIQTDTPVSRGSNYSSAADPRASIGCYGLGTPVGVASLPVNTIYAFGAERSGIALSYENAWEVCKHGGSRKTTLLVYCTEVVDYSFLWIREAERCEYEIAVVSRYGCPLQQEINPNIPEVVSRTDSFWAHPPISIFQLMLVVACFIAGLAFRRAYARRAGPYASVPTTLDTIPVLAVRLDLKDQHDTISGIACLY